MSDQATRIVLLRGINVGGHRKVPMADLRDGLSDAGFDSVRTYIQSGNVVVDGGPGGLIEVEDTVREVIASRFGFDDVSVIAMKADRIETAVAASEREFPDQGTDPKDHARRTHVVFLHRVPASDRRDQLDPGAFGDDRFVLDIHGDVAELHVSYAHGAGTSKLTLDRIERALGVRATGRNLNTVARLLAMSSVT
ncbi:DUF1697 domain-containing protein [Ilumatobacter nonamiensis]|uniref:DUF1697 domain-containing protein n=1 Tax=Ilumatobacter nonamiensis TaxID=467093 RepID=UPI0003467081|nr:DUF1697 domain-containing protein [Ilumatobacter nonamiensis]